MINGSFPDDYAASDRGGVIENLHRIHVAVTDATGKLLLAAGNPQRMTLARSAIKPFQTLTLLEIPGFDDTFGFDQAELALMCASHNSEERHIKLARQMMGKIPGAREEDLRCGGHPAIMPKLNGEWIRREFTPTPIYSNCSGKHCAMLAGASLVGGGTLEEYHSPDHPVQIRVKQTFEEVTGLQPHEIKWGIDGCNLPAPGLPLDDMARLFATFASAASLSPEDRASAPPRTQHLARIYDAMSQHPEMIAGDGRFCTELGLAYKGALVGKIGADACYTIGVRESEATRRLGASGALGIALKIDDGNMEIIYACIPEILERLGIGEPEVVRKLDAFHHLKRLNTANVVVGTVSFPFVLRQV